MLIILLVVLFLLLLWGAWWCCCFYCYNVLFVNVVFVQLPEVDDKFKMSVIVLVFDDIVVFIVIAVIVCFSVFCR
jgi:hypothetical protein